MTTEEKIDKLLQLFQEEKELNVRRFSEIDNRFQGIDSRLYEIDCRFDRLERELFVIDLDKVKRRVDRIEKKIA